MIWRPAAKELVLLLNSGYIPLNFVSCTFLGGYAKTPNQGLALMDGNNLLSLRYLRFELACHG
jgi:hypothetical protein